MAGQQPPDCVLIGDSVTDIEVSRRAGVRSIGYAKTPERGIELAAAGADAIVSEMAALAFGLADYYSDLCSITDMLRSMAGPTQRILNEHWPFRDSNGRTHDEGIPIQRHPIDVGVSLVFSEDGRRMLWAGPSSGPRMLSVSSLTTKSTAIAASGSLRRM